MLQLLSIIWWTATSACKGGQGEAHMNTEGKPTPLMSPTTANSVIPFGGAKDPLLLPCMLLCYRIITILVCDFICNMLIKLKFSLCG